VDARLVPPESMQLFGPGRCRRLCVAIAVVDEIPFCRKLPQFKESVAAVKTGGRLLLAEQPAT